MTLEESCTLAKAVAVVACLVSVAASLWWLSVRLDRHLATANQSLSDTGDLLDARLEAESARYAALLASESAKWRTATDARLAAIQRDTDKRLAAIQADTREQLVPVRDAAVQALASVPPAVSDTRRLIVASEGLVTKATPQVIGLAAGWKQAGGFSAQTLRMVQPDIKTVTSEAAKAAPDARKVIGNVEKITRPPGILMKVVGFFGKLIF